MGLVNANGKPVIATELSVPRVGAWHARLTVDDQTTLAGAVTLAVAGGPTFRGTVVRGRTYIDRARVRVVAGAGGLGRPATPRHYTDTKARVVLADLLRDAGETLSGTAAASALDVPLAAWTTARLTVGALIQRLATTIGATWRMLPEGTLWIGSEAWPDSGLEATDYQVENEIPEDDFALVSMDAPRILPGTLLGGRRVSYVTYDIGSAIRLPVWFESTAARADRFKDAWTGAIGGDTLDAFYRGRYLYLIAEQSDDLVDAEPDGDDRLPSVARVPLRSGIPGARISGATGGRVLIGWHGGDPARPYAESFDVDVLGATVTWDAARLNLGGSGGQRAVLGDVLQGILNTIKSHSHPSNGSPSASLASMADPRAAKVWVK